MWRVHAFVAVVGFSIRSWRERPNPLPLVAVNTSSPAIRLFEGWRTARARRESNVEFGVGRAGDSRTSRSDKTMRLLSLKMIARAYGDADHLGG
jgi:hypothetical protein